MNQTFDLQADDFTLFGLPQQFAQDSAAIDAAWKKLQGQAHPDKFAAQGAAAQRLAMQWSVRINEVYQRLKNPSQRAAYLCQLHGQTIGEHSNTAMPADFLMQQMQWREALEEAQTAKDLESLYDEALSWHKSQLEQCATQLDTAQDYAAASLTVRQLMFVEKFLADIESAMDRN